MKDEPYFDFNDPTYCYPGTDVLRNKMNIHDATELAKTETAYSLMRMMELDRIPVEGELNITYLKEMHRRIFSDVYEWAGEFRTVEISKGVPFCMCAYIQSSLAELMSRLKDENYLEGINDRKIMIEKLAFYLAELNVIHPFREGNGRVQRKFVEQIAKRAGFTLNFDGITSEEMTYAGKASMTCDYGPMQHIIAKSLEYTMNDVMDYAYGKESSGAKSFEGHIRRMIGADSEKTATNVFKITLSKIEEPGGFQIPDFINTEYNICIEVFAGASTGKVVDVVSGVPIVKIRKNNALNHLVDALNHAKSKFNADSADFIRSKYHVVGDLFKIALCAMDFTDYMQLNPDSVVNRMESIRISDYGIDAFVLYYKPAGLMEIYGGDIFVFYENEIEKAIFVDGAKFIQNQVR